MAGESLAIVAAARSWLGVPWRHQGRARQGIDCAGLVVLVGRGLGLTDYDTAAYEGETGQCGVLGGRGHQLETVAGDEAGGGGIAAGDQEPTVPAPPVDR